MVLPILTTLWQLKEIPMWREYYCYSALFTALPGGTGVTFTDVEIRIDTDSDFEFVKTIFQPTTGRARVRYRDDTNGRFLQKGTQDIRTIGGTALYSMAPGSPTPPGFIPFIWPMPYTIPAATTFTVSAADFSGLSYNFHVTFHGNKIRQGDSPWDKKWRAKIPYVYPLSNTGTVAIGANGSASASIATDNDAHFLVQKITGTRTGACLVTIKDGARDRQWMDSPVNFDNLVGNGHFPNILPSPRFIARGSVIAYTFTDLSGLANQAEVNLEGVKLYE